VICRQRGYTPAALFWHHQRAVCTHKKLLREEHPPKVILNALAISISDLLTFSANALFIHQFDFFITGEK
jgi:hypothetical protein